MVSQEKILDALRSIQHPIQKTDIPSSGCIQNVMVNGSIVTITMTIDPDRAELMETVRKACEDAALSVDGVTQARAIMTAERPHQSSGHTAPPTPKPLAGVKNLIAIASGKGGVGKSTTSVNLAYALQKQGLKVGLVDCDVYGPSASILLGIETGPQFTEDDRIKPVERNGLLAMSMSFVVDQDTAAIWRGPMVISAIQQFLNGVAWDIDGQIDVLVADLPPGTGDVQLTLSQTADISGVIIVSTPQDLALADARKAVDMFTKTNTPVLGLIENMSYFVCPNCGERSDVFGHDGAKQTAEKRGIPFLGSIPLHMDIRESSDAGVPILLAQPDGDHSRTYREIASMIARAVIN